MWLSNKDSTFWEEFLNTAGLSVGFKIQVLPIRLCFCNYSLNQLHSLRSLYTLPTKPKTSWVWMFTSLKSLHWLIRGQISVCHNLISYAVFISLRMIGDIYRLLSLLSNIFCLSKFSPQSIEQCLLWFYEL